MSMFTVINTHTRNTDFAGKRRPTIEIVIAGSRQFVREYF